MQTTPWSDVFIIGIPEIDDEHRSLFVRLEDLTEALACGQRTRVQRTLRLIAEHAVEHFGHEERLMRQAGYSGYNWHRQQHETAKKRVGKLVQAAESGGVPECEELVTFLASWLQDHITVHDRMMSASIRNYGRLADQRSTTNRLVLA